MFISTLKGIVEEYDPYGEHRLNGLKSVYILMMLFIVNMIYGIPNPYFNYFYVPLTALMAEAVGETMPAKYGLFFHAAMGSIVAIILFNITAPYPIFFVFFVLFYSITHYLIALHYIKNIFFVIPTVLGLAIYSLVYGEVNTDFYIAVNNALVTLVAVMIILGALVLFPLRYYFRLWRRAYILLLKQITDNFKKTQNHQLIAVIVQEHLIKLLKYSHMLPRNFPITSILKIVLLINDLRVLSFDVDHDMTKMKEQELDCLIHDLEVFTHAVEKKSLCYLSLTSSTNKIFFKMMQSWNNVCLKV